MRKRWSHRDVDHLDPVAGICTRAGKSSHRFVVIVTVQSDKLTAALVGQQQQSSFAVTRQSQRAQAADRRSHFCKVWTGFGCKGLRRRLFSVLKLACEGPLFRHVAVWSILATSNDRGIPLGQNSSTLNESRCARRPETFMLTIDSRCQAAFTQYTQTIFQTLPTSSLDCPRCLERKRGPSQGSS